MFIAVGRLSFHLAGNSSLKGKRSIIRKIMDRASVKFNISIAEVAANDEHRRAIIGVSVIGNSSAHVDSSMAKVVNFIVGLGAAQLVSQKTEVIALGDDFGDEKMFSQIDLDDMYTAFGIEDTDGKR